MYLQRESIVTADIYSSLPTCPSLWRTNRTILIQYNTVYGIIMCACAFHMAVLLFCSVGKRSTNRPGAHKSDHGILSKI